MSLEQRKAAALRKFNEGGNFDWDFNKGPCVDDLVDLGLVTKHRTRDKEFDFRNVSGRDLLIDFCICPAGAFLER